MKSKEIRETFLKFFEIHGHQRVKSSALIPAGDATLLFTNAGMVQFKDCFLGQQDLGFKRATTSQKCVRAGGKHNDLENVGYTARHHTFFEMLGNFSFGDYFKKEAIAFAWTLLTEYYKIPEEKLRVTVFEKDDEAFKLWEAQGVPAARITRLGEKDNFWAMGDTGPCGPCTEIYYDWGKDYGCGKDTCAPGCACEERFVEIWNLVFMQFNRDASGKLAPLPKPSVDTGAGLERVCTVLQGVYNNYDTDLFAPIFREIEKTTGKKYHGDPETDTSMRVLADHLRSSTFLIADGVVPSNEGRGYVLRRILRRAIRHGKNLGKDRPFLFKLVGSVVESLGDVYPEIKQGQKLIQTFIEEEETKFHETLHRGMGLLDETLSELKNAGKAALPGSIAFKLYDTFGFPLDLIEVICRERGFSVDEKDFESLMEKQRSLSTFQKGGAAGIPERLRDTLSKTTHPTEFVGYHSLAGKGSLTHLFDKTGGLIKGLKAGETGFAVFDKTPFYSESGGQVGDKGSFTQGKNRALVHYTSRVNKTVIHQVSVESGEIKSPDAFELNVDSDARSFTKINHTATHMLHAALRKVLGDRVKQAGSLVDSSRLRFDFTYPKALTAEEIERIERMVNEEILKGEPVEVAEMSYDDAIKKGALAFFDEKYGDKVRVVRVGSESDPFSVELCGGTHLTGGTTAQIGLFKITSESSVASGVRRIEAITSATALEFFQSRDRQLKQVEEALAIRNAAGADSNAAFTKVTQLSQQLKSLQKKVEDLEVKVAQSGAKGDAGGGGALHDRSVEVKGLSLIMDKVPSSNSKVLRSLVDQVRDKKKEKTIVLLAAEADGKISLCLGLTKDLVGRFDAGKLIQPVATKLGGTGGGRGDFAQGGGTKPAELDEAFQIFKAWLEQNA